MKRMGLAKAIPIAPHTPVIRMMYNLMPAGRYTRSIPDEYCVSGVRRTLIQPKMSQTAPPKRTPQSVVTAESTLKVLR